MSIPIAYNWEFNLSLLLTLIVSIFSASYTFLINIKNQRIRLLDILNPIIPDVQYCISLPFVFDKVPEYKNDDPLIELSVLRIMKEYKNDIDHYWGYWGKDRYPELEGLNSQKRTEYIEIIEKEVEKQLNRTLIDNGIVSPAFYYDNFEVKAKLDNITNFVLMNQSSFRKELNQYYIFLIKSSPESIRDKYLAQLKLSPEYYLHNDVNFEDSYREILFKIKSKYESLTLTKREKISLIIEKHKFQFKNRKYKNRGRF